MFKLPIGILIAFFWHCLPLHGIQFHMKPNTIKCMREDVSPRLFLTIQYNAVAVPNQFVDLIIRDEQGNTLRSRQNITDGKYTFEKNAAYKSYEFCYGVFVTEHKEGGLQTVSLTTMKTKKKTEKPEEHHYNPGTLEKILLLEDCANSILEDYALARDIEAMIPSECEVALEIMLLFSTICKFALCLVLASTQILFICLYLQAKLSAAQQNHQVQKKTPEEKVSKVPMI